MQGQLKNNETQTQRRGIVHGVESSTLADVLERILDKGLVIAGDIKIKLVDIELLTIQIRLLICSVDKAKDMGIDWWSDNAYLNPKKVAQALQAAETPPPVTAWQPQTPVDYETTPSTGHS
jgi:hypothetical protein